MIIYVDGACSGNPGPGGYGVVILDDEEQLIEQYSHHENMTTNNIQELKAIIYVLLKYGTGGNKPIVYSDSAYAVNTFTKWMFTWAKNNWYKSDKKPPENLNLIQAYYNLWVDGGHRIDLRKVQGHSGNKWNEMADKLAKGEIK